MSHKEYFGSRWGFLAAAIGMAVGTGNIWRFPRMAAQYGGGAFILAYTCALFLWSAPLLMAEMAIGRKTRMGPIGGFRDFVGRRYTWMGGWMVGVCLLIMFYYSVVTGWCIKYFTLALRGAFREGADTAAIWHGFQYDPWQNVLFHTLSIGSCGLIVYSGVKSGVERVSKIMVPALFLFLVIAAVRAVSLDGAADGLTYMFVPAWSRLAEPETWLQAFTQSAWSTGAGWGLMLTYAVYTSHREDIPQNALLVGFSDQTAALLAGLVVIPTVFALSPQFEATEALADYKGLTFVTLARLFPRMPGGMIIAPIFFLALVFAAFTSLIAMVEVGARALIDVGIDRRRATIFVAGIGFLCGLPSAMAPSLLDNQDWVWGVALLLSGFFTIVAVWKYGADRVRCELVNPNADIRMGRWWTAIIKYVSPVVFVGLLGWWLSRGISDNPETWWKPLSTYSTMTILCQWAILILVLVVANSALAGVTRERPSGQEPM